MKFLTKICPQIVILLGFCLWIYGCSFQDTPQAMIVAQIVRVISGQTIEVVIDRSNEQPQRVRMIGIDVPQIENNQWSDRAKARLQELITDNQVALELESNETDRYNRLLAHVWHHDTLLSEQLTKEGYAVVNDKYPHRYSDRLFYAQEYARILGYGIWH